MIIRVIGYNEYSFQNTITEFNLDVEHGEQDLIKYIILLLKGKFTDMIRIQKLYGTAGE